MSSFEPNYTSFRSSAGTFDFEFCFTLIFFVLFLQLYVCFMFSGQLTC